MGFMKIEKVYRYLKIAGLYENVGFSENDKMKFVNSLSNKEIEEYDSYDLDSECCSNCIQYMNMEELKKRNLRKTKIGKRCMNCGWMVRDSKRRIYVIQNT